MTQNGTEEDGGTGPRAVARFDTDPNVPIARRLEDYAEALEVEGSTETARVVREALRAYHERTEAGDAVGALLALHSIGTRAGE